MTVPQFGIFAQGTIAHVFIEFELRPDVEIGKATAALSQLRAPAAAGRGGQPPDRRERRGGGG